MVALLLLFFFLISCLPIKPANIHENRIKWGFVMGCNIARGFLFGSVAVVVLFYVLLNDPAGAVEFLGLNPELLLAK